MSTNTTHRGLVPLLLMAGSLTVMAGAVIGPVVAEIGKALSLTPTQSGRLITTHGLTIAVVSLAAGLRPYSRGTGFRRYVYGGSGIAACTASADGGSGSPGPPDGRVRAKLVAKHWEPAYVTLERKGELASRTI